MLSAPVVNDPEAMQPTFGDGLAKGTEVMTLSGVQPVEKLSAGERIVTRTGARPLRDLMKKASGGYAMLFDRPQIVYLTDGQAHSDSGLPFAA